VWVGDNLCSPPLAQAMENIERGYNVKLGPSFKQLKLKYKATPEVPT